MNMNNEYTNQDRKILIITEKPMVAKRIADLFSAYQRQDGYYEGNSYLVSWCLGHLLGYADPDVYDPKLQKWNLKDLPIIPEPWKMVTDPDKTEHAAKLFELMNRSDVSEIVNACDAGREGELIFRNAYEASGSNTPVTRLWINSMEEDAIRNGFEQRRPSEDYDRLGAAAQCRAKADWLVGINATRAYSCKYGETLKVGRVQTPTLAMLASREREIRDHVDETSFVVRLNTGRGLTLESDPIKERSDAQKMLEKCDGKDVIISSVEKKEKETPSPELYDLTSLQRDANRILGFSAKHTLQILQDLYLDKLITYPRTDSRYIPKDMEKTVEQLLKSIREFEGFADLSCDYQVFRVVNDDKVGDHTAILPTSQLTPTAIKDRKDEEKSILYLIFLRIIEATSIPCKQTQFLVTGECEGETFHAKGSLMETEGFLSTRKRFLQHYYPKQWKEVHWDLTEECMKQIRSEDVFPVESGKLQERHSKAPRRYTENTLLQAMESAESKAFSPDAERKGLGTPSTRADVIEKLLSTGSVFRQGRFLMVTEEGERLISRMPEFLVSASTTAEWENRLVDIEKGKGDADRFLKEISIVVNDLIEDVRAIPDPENASHIALGSCTRCGYPVREGKHNFYCTEEKCGFVLWKENRFLDAIGKKLDRDMAEDLLRDKITHVTDCYSKKKRKRFIADLCMNVDEKGKVLYFLKFPDEHD